MFKTTIFTKPVHRWKSSSGRWVRAVLDQMVASTSVAFDFEWHFLISVLLIWSYQYHRSRLNWISVLMESTCICPVILRTRQLNVWLRSIRLYKHKISASVRIISLCIMYRNRAWRRWLQPKTGLATSRWLIIHALIACLLDSCDGRFSDPK